MANTVAAPGVTGDEGETRQREPGSPPAGLRDGVCPPYTCLVKGARMTVTCDCEAVRLLAYGERWTCEGCGRRA